MNSRIGLRENYAPRGNVIIKGEDIPNIGQSGIARNFIVELTPNDIPIGEALSRSQQFARDGYYTDFMREYINWLTPKTDELSEKLKRRFEHYREKSHRRKCGGLWHNRRSDSLTYDWL